MINKKILLNLEATPSCPARCSMCPRDLIRDKGFMSIETMNKITSQLTEEQVWEVDLAGRGEPTIHPDFYELTKAMKIKNVPSCIVTTGVMANEKILRALNDNLDVIRLSISSIQKSIFDQVHIGLDHKRIWNNIEKIAEVASEKAIIHLTGGPVIYDTLAQTVSFLRGLGFRSFRLLTLWNRGGVFESSQNREKRKELMQDLHISPSENEAWSGSGKVKFFSSFALNRLKNKSFCPIGDSSLSISYDGKILGCFQDFGHTSNIGHIDKISIKKIIKERVKTLGCMDICKGCDAKNVTLFDIRKS